MTLCKLVLTKMQNIHWISLMLLGYVINHRHSLELDTKINQGHNISPDLNGMHFIHLYTEESRVFLSLKTSLSLLLRIIGQKSKS